MGSVTARSALSIDEQERWLDRAADNKLSIRDLRRALIDARERAPDQTATTREVDNGHHAAAELRSARARDVAGGLLTCPQCGHRFEGEGESNGLTQPDVN